MRTPVPRDARRDVEAIARFYAREAGSDVALGFTAAFRSAVDLLRTFPESGSTRFAAVTGIENLRALPLKGYPYLIFYRFDGTTVLILRILHTSRDIPASLRP